MSVGYWGSGRDKVLFDLGKANEQNDESPLDESPGPDSE